MEQKRVSFKIAKVIKEAGYPQDKFNYNQYYTEGGYLSDLYQYGVPYYVVDCFAPTYLDVWLWLWRDKDIKINIDGKYLTIKHLYTKRYAKEISNPEEAIIAAIEYLVDNNLIK